MHPEYLPQSIENPAKKKRKKGSFFKIEQKSGLNLESSGSDSEKTYKDEDAEVDVFNEDYNGRTENGQYQNIIDYSN